MILTKLHHPQLKPFWMDGQFYYTEGKSTLLHPVDRILKVTYTKEAATGLTRSCQQLGERELKRKLFIGKTLHQLIEQSLQGNALAHCSNLIQPYWQSVQPVLKKITGKSFVETAFPYKGRYPYAGKVDFVGEYKGTPCVIEWTTAEEPKGLAEKLYDKRLQLTAHCGAINHYSLLQY